MVHVLKLLVDAVAITVGIGIGVIGGFALAAAGVLWMSRKTVKSAAKAIERAATKRVGW